MNAVKSPPTMEQRRAEYAWRKSGIGDKKALEKYAKLAKGLPVLVMGSGLMQTMAFLRDKNDEQHRELLGHLLEWLADRLGGEETNAAAHPFPRREQLAFEPMMQALFHAHPQQYQRATREALMILRWIRQMASAR